MLNGNLFIYLIKRNNIKISMFSLFNAIVYLFTDVFLFYYIKQIEFKKSYNHTR